MNEFDHLPIGIAIPAGDGGTFRPDTPRGVVGDWLEERGRTTAADLVRSAKLLEICEGRIVEKTVVDWLFSYRINYPRRPAVMPIDGATAIYVPRAPHETADWRISIEERGPFGRGPSLVYGRLPTNRLAIIPIEPIA
jgi:hypothetical protein